MNPQIVKRESKLAKATIDGGRAAVSSTKQRRQREAKSHSGSPLGLVPEELLLGCCDMGQIMMKLVCCFARVNQLTPAYLFMLYLRRCEASPFGREDRW